MQDSEGRVNLRSSLNAKISLSIHELAVTGRKRQTQQRTESRLTRPAKGGRAADTNYRNG